MAKLSVDQALLKAKSHTNNGELKEAQKLYQTVLEAFPKNKRAQKGLAALNKPKKSNTYERPPQDKTNQLLNLYNHGQLEVVVEQAKALTLQYPDAFVVWNILGAAAAQTGQIEQAINAFKRVIAIKPDYADSYNNMGNILKEQGKLEEAIAAFNKAISLKPDYAEAHNNMAVTLQKQGKLEEAIEAYKKAIAIKPDYAEAHYNMGVNIQEQGKLDEAIACYKKALSLKPEYAEAHNNMGVVLHDQGKLDEALACYNKALSLKPEYAEAYNNMGNALKDQGKLTASIESYQKALSLKPDYPDVYNNMGVVLQDQGKLDEAIASYQIVLSFKSDYAEAHKNLSMLIKYKPDDAQITLVREMMQRSDLKDDDRCHLHYTLAKMSEDVGDLDIAYDHYVAGGKLRKKLLSYDFKQDELIFDQTKNTAPKYKGFSLDTPIETTTNTPVFILGMPRSGTTLVEQIISSHSQVHGAGELPFLDRFGGALSLGNQIISSENVLQMRNAYLHELEKVSSGCQFVTDKMPQNFLQIGLILKALPEAKVIHVKRDPAATCWSNFKHYFDVKGLGYSYDLKDTVNYFKIYQDLMEFWDQQYSDQIYHLDYDKLTLEQEPETRKLIQHLGLDWEDNCLSPQENKRSVKTASQQQVRQKIYTGSSQAWRKYKPFLDGIFDQLET